MNFLNNSILSKIFAINTPQLIKHNNIEHKQNLNLKTKHYKNLHDSLKQLEFISCFEMYIDKKKADSYSLSFLQELESIRYYAELNTLKSIECCKK
jgi:hypothetical protein